MTTSELIQLSKTIRRLKDDNLIDGTFELCEAICQDFNLSDIDKWNFNYRVMEASNESL
jgi:hypothetical protein